MTARWTEQQYQDFLRRRRMPRSASEPSGSPQPVLEPSNKESVGKRKPHGPNRTEERYKRDYLTHPATVTVRFQPFRLYLSNGHSYRPDWGVFYPDGKIALHEVKGPHVHSRDSRILFDTAITDFPWLGFVWAQWTGEKWKLQVHYPDAWRWCATNTEGGGGEDA